MTKLEIAKDVIKRFISEAEYGIFDSRNITGDIMATVYNKDGLTIDICYGYSYFEVFGLTDGEFEELADYYEEIRAEYRGNENADIT